MLRDAGYVSGGFVSAYVLREETGIGKCFDHFDARCRPRRRRVAIGQLQRDGDATLAAADSGSTRVRSPRFFLFFHIYEPHSPYTPPPRFAQYAPYDGEIASADEIVGRLIARSSGAQLYDDALVVLLSDHGEGLGDHGEQEHGLFLYAKRSVCRSSSSCPATPERRTPRRDAGAAHRPRPDDLDWLAPAQPAALRGRSLRPLFDGGTIPEQGDLLPKRSYSRYHFGWSELYALTDAQYSFIRAPRDELYDVQKDPGQLDEPRAAARRDAAGDAGRPGSSDRRRPASRRPADVSAEARERLRALGYVGTAPSASVAGESLPDPKDKVQVLERYRAGIALVDEGTVRGRVDGFRAIAAENPTMADVWSEIAGLALRLGRNEEALAAYKHVVTWRRTIPGALVSVADTLSSSDARRSAARRRPPPRTSFPPPRCAGARGRIRRWRWSRSRGTIRSLRAPRHHGARHRSDAADAAIRRRADPLQCRMSSRRPCRFCSRRCSKEWQHGSGSGTSLLSG